MLISIGIVTASNLSIGTKSKNDESYSHSQISDYVALLIIILLGIALGLFLILRPTPEPIARYLSAESIYIWNNN